MLVGKSFTEFVNEDILNEEKEKRQKKRQVISHLEDLPHQVGNDGVGHIGEVLDDLHTTLSGKQKSNFNAPKAKTKVMQKFDGKPSIMFGYHPSNKKFFVSSKAVNKPAFTPQHIDNYYKDDPDTAEKMKAALTHLKKVTPKGAIYGGDYLYGMNDKDETKSGIEFTPNVITYKVKPGPEHTKIKNSKFGIVVHSKYDGKQPSPDVDHTKFKNHQDVHIINPQVQINPALYTTRR